MNYLNKPDAGAAPQLKGAAKDNQRRAEHGRDQTMHSAKPKVERQIGDGLPVPNQGNKPTKGGIVQRPASPMNLNTSGMENAMGALADKMHPRRK